MWHSNVRAVTITAINLVDTNIPFQVDLFTDMKEVEKRNRVDNAVEELRGKFGKCAVVNASLLNSNVCKKTLTKYSCFDIIISDFITLV